MIEEPKIRNLRTLQEAKVRLYLQAQYHRVGMELEVRKAVSIGGLLGKIKGKIAGGSQETSTEEGVKSGFSYAPIIGTLVTIAVSIAAAKIKTGQSWVDVFKLVLLDSISKYKGQLLGALGSVLTK